MRGFVSEEKNGERFSEFLENRRKTWPQIAQQKTNHYGKLLSEEVDCTNIKTDGKIGPLIS